MFSLQDLLGQEQGTQAVEQISQNVGADSSLVNSAIQLALPALINGLANNASTPEGAESLNTALEQDHAGGGILDNLGGLAGMIFGGGQAAPPPRQADAGGKVGDGDAAVGCQHVQDAQAGGLGQRLEIRGDRGQRLGGKFLHLGAIGT